MSRGNSYSKFDVPYYFKMHSKCFLPTENPNGLHGSGSATAIPVKRGAILHELAGETGQTR